MSARLAGVFFLAALTLPAQKGQNPSPMVEHTRPHPRLKPSTPAGRRETLETGGLFIPHKLRARRQLPVVVHFHGASFVPEIAAASYGKAAVISVQLGSGSGAYSQPFTDAERFAAMLKEAEAKARVRFSRVTLSAWSAGYGAVREILRDPRYYKQVCCVLLIDGLHTDYVNGHPGPLESQLDSEGVEVFLKFARDAVANRKQFVVVHSEIFPGTFASTTETADWLVRQLDLVRRPVLRQGPMGSQQLSDLVRRGFHMAGFAGNSAPDHVDLFQALPAFLRWFK